MRVVNQITFEAKDDAEALRLAGERLGKDAVILSTRSVQVGGFLGFFQKQVLMVSAGILQDDQKEEKAKEKGKEKEKEDEAAARERFVAFQKLLEFKQAAEARNGNSGNGDQALPSSEILFPQSGNSAGGRVTYTSPVVRRSAQEPDSVHLSQEGLESVSRQTKTPDSTDNRKLREEVGELSKRIDMILQRLEESAERPVVAASRGSVGSEGVFSGASPAVLIGSSTQESVDMDELYQKLLRAEIDSVYARQLILDYRGTGGLLPFEKWLASKVHCAAGTPGEVMGGRKVMLLGPTGVGKTTTIAKLAAIQALWEHRDVLLLTSDTYRIAAVDQLRTYAKILGVPIEVIFEAENFATVLEAHASAELILLDTAGRGQKDRKNLEVFETLYNAFQPDAVHLVLAANMKYRDMLDVVERMAVVPISHVLFTKLDETTSYGALFNILQTLKRPLSFFTTGQNVPNDIEVGSGQRLAGLLLGDGIRRGVL